MLGALRPLAMVAALMASVTLVLHTAESEFYRDASGYPLSYRGPFAVCPHCAGDSGYCAAHRWRCPRCNVELPAEVRDGNHQ